MLEVLLHDICGRAGFPSLGLQPHCPWPRTYSWRGEFGGWTSVQADGTGLLWSSRTTTQWPQNFWMWKSTFQELCAWLASALQHQDTHLQSAITLEKRIVIVLWKLATPDSYLSVGHQFGMGKSTVGAVLMEVVTAINSELLHRTVCLGDLDTILAGFAGLGFLNCGGALDGTHILIRAPPHRAAQYINRKGYFSMVLQALVDQQRQFTDTCVGWSGRAHDARIFRNSYLYRRL